MSSFDNANETTILTLPARPKDRLATIEYPSCHCMEMTTMTLRDADEGDTHSFSKIPCASFTPEQHAHRLLRSFHQLQTPHEIASDSHEQQPCCQLTKGALNPLSESLTMTTNASTRCPRRRCSRHPWTPAVLTTSKSSQDFWRRPRVP